MIHIVGVTGQLGNQLFRFAHHLANGLKYEYIVHNVGFSYSNLFPELSKHPLVKIDSADTKLQKNLVKAAAKLINQKFTQQMLSKAGVITITESFTFNEEDSQFISQVRNSHVIATTWLFRDYKNVTAMAPYIRSLLTLPAYTRLEAERRLKKIRSNNNDLIVGVHLRRGDYKTWQNGKYYFDEKVFVDLMKHIRELHMSHTVRFMIFSNEKIEKSLFKDLHVNFDTQSFASDLATMSLCDYLIGPPSTFSGWASFFGEVPLYTMDKDSYLPSKEDFRILAG